MNRLEKKIIRLVNRKTRSYAEVIYRCREYSIRDVDAAVKTLLDAERIIGLRWHNSAGCYDPILARA